MRKIIICEAFSSGINYIDDIKNLGYEPIILETNMPKTVQEYNVRLSHYSQYHGELPKIIRESKNYEETLDIISKLDPIALVIGHEAGVSLGTNIAYDLGLQGNDKRLLAQMIEKLSMHQALKKAGLRYINGKMISNYDEALNFWEELNKQTVVIKPNSGGGSNNIFVCTNISEIQNACHIIFNSTNLFGSKINEALIQECIFGDEYIVDTMSLEGKTYISHMWKYVKIQLDGGAKILNYQYSICDNEINDQIKELTEYAKKTINAIGIKNGPIHGEYMIDDKGPVLMEVNCRVCGGNMPAGFLDKIFGHHETDIHLEALFDKEAFNSRLNTGYSTKAKGFEKFIIVPYDCVVDDAPILDIAKNCDSFYSSFSIFRNKKVNLKRTVDLDSSGGTLYMASENPEIVINEVKYICEKEKQDFNNIYHVVEKTR